MLLKGFVRRHEVCGYTCRAERISNSLEMLNGYTICDCLCSVCKIFICFENISVQILLQDDLFENRLGGVSVTR